MSAREVLPVLQQFWDNIVQLNTDLKEGKMQKRLNTQLEELKTQNQQSIDEAMAKSKNVISDTISQGLATLQTELSRSLANAIKDQLAPINTKIANMENQQTPVLTELVKVEMTKVSEAMKLKTEIMGNTLTGKITPLTAEVNALKHQVNNMGPKKTTQELKHLVATQLHDWDDHIDGKLKPFSEHLRTCMGQDRTNELITEKITEAAFNPYNTKTITDAIHSALIPINGTLHTISAQIDPKTLSATIKNNLKGLMESEQIATISDLKDIRQRLESTPSKEEIGALRMELNSLSSQMENDEIDRDDSGKYQSDEPPSDPDNRQRVHFLLNKWKREQPLSDPPQEHSTPINRETLSKMQQQINDLQDRSMNPDASETHHNEVMTRMPRLTRFEAKPGQNFDVFISRFESMAFRQGWSEDNKLDRLWDSIDGPPANLAAKCKNPTYRRIKSTLSDRYSQQKSEHIAALEMDALCQGPKETLEEFYARVVEIVPYARPNLPAEAIEEELNTRFKNGLIGKDIKWHVWQAKPTNISQSLELAKEARSMLKTIGGKSDRHSDPLINQVVVDNPHKDRECYSCHKLGHIATDCPNRQQNTNSGQRYTSPDRQRYSSPDRPRYQSPNRPRYQSPNRPRYQSPNRSNYTSPNRQYDRDRNTNSYNGTMSNQYGQSSDRNNPRGRSTDRNSNTLRPREQYNTDSRPSDGTYNQNRDRGREPYRNNWRDRSPSQPKGRDERPYSPSRNHYYPNAPKPTQDQYNPNINKPNSRQNSADRYESRNNSLDAQTLSVNELTEARKLVDAANYLKNSKMTTRRAASPARPNTQTSAKCFRCNETGHMIAQCPLNVAQLEVLPTQTEKTE
jgi:hypothetical protein